ncbi:MAG: efflux RND transporter periplasmic adaptor subunit [Pseudomonadota bacterium]
MNAAAKESSAPPPGDAGAGKRHVVRPALAVTAAIAAAALLFIRPWSHEPEPEPDRVGMTVEGDSIRLARTAPQWKFLELKQATLGAPLPPVPAPGRVTVDESRAAPVFSPVEGRVETIAVTLGQTVRTGEKVVAVRSAVVPELMRDMASTREMLSLKTVAAQRVKDLVALHAVPEKELELAQTEQREAELAVQAAQGKLRSLRVAESDGGGLFWVKAPRAGIVVERRGLVGQEAGPDRSDPLLVVADLAEVVVIADVLERDASGLHAGQTALVTSLALPDGLPGKVVHVGDIVDPVRRTVAVRILVPNASRAMRPNGFVRVVFQAPGQPRVIVPSEAVVTDDQKTVVFVAAAADGRLARRPVKTGRTRDGQTEVIEGLAAGERYAAHGALLLLNAIELAR